jgi:hypothetical protein
MRAWFRRQRFDWSVIPAILIIAAVIVVACRLAKMFGWFAGSLFH